MVDTLQTNLTEQSVDERLARGKALRDRVPRSAHAGWKPAKDRPDPIALLEATSQDRLPELIPIRYGRMVQSPFTFLRGSAAAMAADLAKTPTTGIRVQLCGDCHLLNFGAFGTPERNLIFDLMDFDETLPGPWEWDVKRLATSVVVAGRSIDLPFHRCQEAALGMLRTYRERMYEYARMRALEVWYARIDIQAVIDRATTPRTRQLIERTAEKARARTGENLVPRLTQVVDGKRRIIDKPPLIFHGGSDASFEKSAHGLLHSYRETLQEDRRVLLDRYRPIDVAMKVVGVGSVGTRCAIVLMMAGDTDPLILQFKEARRSVLEPFAGPSQYDNQGQRVVNGQRLLQSASDAFLGWTRAESGRDYYFRQLRDMKGTIHVEPMTAEDLCGYARLCGWALARAHARAGDPALISGYLGKSEAFDEAVADFAGAYADQNERDYQVMAAAVKSGRLHAEIQKINGEGK